MLIDGYEEGIAGTIGGSDLAQQTIETRLGDVDLIYSEPGSADENSRIAKLILTSQESLFQMMHNMPDMDKIVAGTPFVANKRPCDLSLLLSKVTATMQFLAEDNDIALHTEINGDLPEVLVDPSQIERIVTNLVSSALKYTESGGTVHVWATTVEQQLLLAVEDCGYGIAPEALPTIFEQYKRAPEHQDKAIGSGLGLAIVKALVNAHDGEISVESEVGKGSKFIVKLPHNVMA